MTTRTPPAQHRWIVTCWWQNTDGTVHATTEVRATARAAVLLYKRWRDAPTVELGMPTDAVCLSIGPALEEVRQGSGGWAISGRVAPEMMLFDVRDAPQDSAGFAARLADITGQAAA